MITSVLDKLHKQRVDAVAKNWRETSELRVEDVFISRRVIESLDKDKALLTSFRPLTILPLLPFVPALYVLTCPSCVTAENSAAFKKLTETGLVIPILTAPYREYPTAVVEIVDGLDHMSYYEFSFYRFTSVMGGAETILCSHCIGEQRKRIAQAAKRLEPSGVRKKFIDQVFGNLHPFIGADAAYFDSFERAIDACQIAQYKRLYDLSYVINADRTASAFHAAQVMRDLDIAKVPQGTTTSSDEARTMAMRLTAFVAEGLKLRVPTNIPLDAYVELVRDYRPTILRLSKDLLVEATIGNEVSIRHLFDSINSINRDIERVANTRRYMLLEALVGFAQNNPAFVASAMVAGTLGLAGTLTGCAALPVGFVADLAAKAGKLKSSPAAQRLKRRLRRDLQPTLDKLIARYVGSTSTAVHILSIREDLIGSTVKAPSVAGAGQKLVRTIEQ